MPPALIAASSLLVLAVAVHVCWSKVRRRLVRVAVGVYRSGTFPTRRLPSVVTRHGIRTVIDFRRPSRAVESEGEVLSRMGVVHVNIPASKSPTRPCVEQFLATIRGVERPVLIHCQHGAGRAPLFAALYLVECESWTPEQALRRASWPSLRAGTPRRRAQLERASLVALGQPHGGASRAAPGPTRLAWHYKLLIAMTAVLAPVWLAGAIDRETAPLGAALLIAGVAWHGWCSGFVREDRDAFRRGPHALVRHPRYLGNLLVITGAALTVPLDGVLQAALPLLALAVCVLRAARVERKLERRRPALVAEPKRILPAVLPSPASLLRALRERRLGGFDWARVRGEGGHLLVLPLLASLLLL